MEFEKEIDAVIKEGFEEFKDHILRKLKKDGNYLGYFFWTHGGVQMTVLNYLIQQHQKKKEGIDQAPCDLTEFIDFVLRNMSDKQVGRPLHQVIASRKIQLACHLLDNYAFQADDYDHQGHSLLSLVLVTKNQYLLEKILENGTNIHAINCFTKACVPCQPLHEAVMLDYPFAVKRLGQAGAQLGNPIGAMKETPLLLAARLGKIQVLEALLEFPIEKLNLEAENDQLVADKEGGDNAIESLCRLLIDKGKNKDLIRGVAMLLCCGAEPPRNEAMCRFLAGKRDDLLKAVEHYLNDKPDKVEPFVCRCHVTGTALHQIIYEDNSWRGSLRKFFGRPNQTAFIIEKWVTRKYSHSPTTHSDSLPLPTSLVKEGDPLKLYAEFVRRYSEAYRNQRITNPWSVMRWMIAQGKCNWDTVVQYAKNHPGTRTQIVYDDMFKNLPKIKINEALDTRKSDEKVMDTEPSHASCQN